MRTLEIACFNLESAAIAQTAGADRIELCDNYAEGGTTPSYGLLKQARKLLHIPIYVMIRPRGGDFVYSPDEWAAMLEDVKQCKQLGMDGIVFGALNSDSTIDEARCAEFMALAKPLPVTFHKAFDVIIDQSTALQQLIALGISRVLTSGGAATALEGAAQIAQLQQQAADKITIIAGGGLRADNVQQIIQQTWVTEVHSAAITDKNQAYPIPNVQEIIGIKEVMKL